MVISHVLLCNAKKYAEVLAREWSDKDEAGEGWLSSSKFSQLIGSVLLLHGTPLKPLGGHAKITIYQIYIFAMGFDA